MFDVALDEVEFPLNAVTRYVYDVFSSNPSASDNWFNSANIKFGWFESVNERSEGSAVKAICSYPVPLVRSIRKFVTLTIG